MLFGFIIPTLLAKWAAAIAVPIAVVAVAKLALTVDTKVENRRRVAIDISERLNEQGFTLFDELLKSYAVGDKSGMLKTLIELAKIVKDPEILSVHLARVFSTQLRNRVQDPGQRMEIAQALKDVETLEAADLVDRVKESKTNITTIVGPLKTE